MADLNPTDGNADDIGYIPISVSPPSVATNLSNYSPAYVQSAYTDTSNISSYYKYDDQTNYYYESESGTIYGYSPTKPIVKIRVNDTTLWQENSPPDRDPTVREEMQKIVDSWQ